MASIRDMDGPSAQKKATEVLESFEAHTEYYDDGGQFLPLAVWANQGYNVEDIENKSQPPTKSGTMSWAGPTE